MSTLANISLDFSITQVHQVFIHHPFTSKPSKSSKSRIQPALFLLTIIILNLIRKQSNLKQTRTLSIYFKEMPKTIDQLKASGTASFKQKDYAKALESYQTAVDLIDIKAERSKGKISSSKLLIKKQLLSNMAAAYTKLEMYQAAIETCELALLIIHSSTESELETITKSNEISSKLYIRMALAFESSGSLSDYRKAIKSLIRSIPPQSNYKRTIYHNINVGTEPRHIRQGKAVPNATKKIFNRLKKALYGTDGTFCVTAKENLTTNLERPWQANAGWCRTSKDSDEILYWSGKM